MSTILDALRKLQRERTAANPSRDLRGSVTDEIPMPQPRRSPPRRGLALGVLAASLAILVGVGGTWLYKRGVFTRAPAAPAQVAAEPQVAAEQEEPEGELPTDAEFEEQVRDMAVREAAGEAPPPVAASPNPPPDVPASNADEAAVERARLEEVRRAAAAADEARRQAEAKAAADDAADAATAASPDPPPTAALLAPPPALALAPVVVPPPRLVAKPKPAPKAKPAPPPPARREPPPDANPDADTLAPTAFPEVRVESIRWHPLAERRAASLRFAQQNVADAHEGDIIGGVLVFRIEPGAVELRVGSTSHVVRPSP